MSEKKWKRARSREQIEQRVQAILDAAGKVFQQEPYEHVTMQMIAKETGFTRSNLYRYFSTREEIFLTLFTRDFEICVQQFISAFTQEETLDVFTQKWTEILCQQHRYLRLSPLFSLSLEKNSSEEIYRKTKLALNEATKNVIPALQKAIPSLTAEQCVKFLLFQQALLAGLWPMAQYSDMQRRVLDDLALHHFHVDFASFYEKTLLMYLRGVIEENIQKTRALKPEPEPASQFPPELERGLEQIDDIREKVTQMWEVLTSSRPHIRSE